MPITRLLSRTSARAALLALAPLAFIGCGGTEAPPTEAAALPASTVVQEDTVFQNAAAPLTTASPDGGTPEQTAPIAPPELASVRDRDALQRTAAEVEQGAGDLKSGVTRAVGNAQTQATEAASSAVDGARGFASELRDDAQKSLNDAASEAKAGVQDSVQEAKNGIQGAVNGAKANAQAKVRSAVAGAKDQARDKARAAAEAARKSAQDMEKNLLDGVLGPDTPPTAPKR